MEELKTKSIHAIIMIDYNAYVDVFRVRFSLYFEESRGLRC